MEPMEWSKSEWRKCWVVAQGECVRLAACYVQQALRQCALQCAHVHVVTSARCLDEHTSRAELESEVKRVRVLECGEACGDERMVTAGDQRITLDEPLGLLR